MATQNAIGATEDELSGLSDEERAAILGEDEEGNEIDDTGGGSDNTPNDNGDDDDDTVGGGEDTLNPADSDTTSGDTSSGEDTIAAAAADVVDLSKFDEPPTDVEISFTPVEDFDSKMADIETKRADLSKKLSDGDIELTEFLQENNKLSSEETELRVKKATADQAEQHNKNVQEQRQQWEVERWKAVNKEFFSRPENSIYKDPASAKQIDNAVKLLAADPDNADKPGEWFLQEADKMARALLGVKSTPQLKKQEKPRSGIKPSDIPPSLSSLPAAESNETGASEFDYLSKLEGMDLERAVASMPKDKYERYLLETA